jgi:phage shock protein PspC (stress-responsive transcriptional regulator)
MLFIVSANEGQSGAMRAEDAVKDFWATRPRRPRRGRKIAGVAAGFGNRYRIDPVLVRVGFVVAAIYGGAGVLVYLLGWLFLPEQDDEVSPFESLIGRGRSSTSSGFTVLLCIGLIPVLSWFFSGGFIGAFPSWLSLAVVGGLLYLLHQSRGHLRPVSPTAPSAATPPVPPTMPVPPEPPVFPMGMPSVATPSAPTVEVPLPPPAGAPVDAGPEPAPRTTPPSWDPLGAAPFAWDLPEPAGQEPAEEPEPPALKRRKSRIGMATVGLALVVSAGMSFAMGGWISPQHIVGVALAILGLGMVAGSFVRGGRGLIALAVPLSVAGLALTSIGPEGYQGLGNLDATPRSIGAVHDSYERSVGNVTLDLRSLPSVGEVRTEARTDLGNVTVIVPADADVTVKCQADKGNADCLDQHESGLEVEIGEFTDTGADGPGGLEIELDVRADIGNVEVRRG